MNAMNAVQHEVDRNYEEFQKLLPTLDDKSGKFALMREGRIINFYDTFADAYTTGKAVYDDRLFSVQRVTTEPVDLGFLSHALHIR